MNYEYDVTLSFAGEDRGYVEEVAKILVEQGIKVFYDKSETVDLWGKDLGVHFDYVFRKGARYCIPFISEHYKKKIWTNYEIKTALARAIETNGEYILPARFDDTEIDGIRSTLGFIDLRKYTPQEFASLIISKVRNEPSAPLPEKEQIDSGKIYLGIKVLISEFQGKIGASLGVSITNTIKEYRYFNEPSFKLTNPFQGGTDSFFMFDKLYPVTFPLKLEYGQVGAVDYRLITNSLQMWTKLPEDTLVQAIATTTVGEKFKSNQVKVSEIIRTLNS